MKKSVPKRDVQTCCYCGLHHKDVEAGGIWHCPNPCCLGPGQSYAHTQLVSYRECSGNCHTVDLDELFSVGLCKATECGDSAIATQAFVSVLREHIRYQWFGK